MGDHESSTTPPTPPHVISQTRGYQQEMLEDSMHKNLVIALDTGAGKTHIAVLRMKWEAEQESSKVSWFLVPTVALCEQQREVIDSHLPVSVGMITGANEPDQWKDHKLWQRVLQTHKIIVSTHAVLLNALRHGYINMGRDISLLVFDEAHHTADKHPYNLIMREFYFNLPRRSGDFAYDATANVRPMVLGLTASPVFGGDIEKAFRTLEANLDSTIRAPLRFREELSGFVHRPEFKHVIYAAPEYKMVGPSPSTNLTSLQSVVASLNIEEDPYVLSLREKLSRLPQGPDRHRTDQKLSKVINKQDSYTHKGLRDFMRAAEEICSDLGRWAADWYIQQVIRQALSADGMFPDYASVWSNREKQYLMDTLARVEITPVSYDSEDIVARSSDKVRALVDTLIAEKAAFEALGEEYRGLVFVTRRDSVLALVEVLASYPGIADSFVTGCLLGMSESSRRRAFLDITRNLLRQPAAETLRDFKAGEIDLIIATAVAEEGLDIQACCNVVRWDAPPNMVSWAQSRGRARKKRSTFVLMFSDDSVHHGMVKDWERLELEMVRLYNSERARLMFEEEEYRASALLTLDSAIEHLNHFCSVLPNSGHGEHMPIYDIDPPDYPEEWHTFGGSNPPYMGPYGCTVTLPKLVDPKFRVFTTPCIHSQKVIARQHVAFLAYLELHKHGLLNEHLLPLTSVLEPENEEEVKNLLKEVEKRAGTARVTSQMNPWLPDFGDEQEEEQWYTTTVSFDDIHPLKLLTRTRLSPLQEDQMPLLHPRDRGPLRVHIHTDEPALSVSDDDIARAKEFTRRLFWPFFGSRMDWDDLNFAYLFLEAPASKPDVWAERRLVHDAEPLVPGLAPLRFFARVAWFAERFGRTKDLCIVSDIRRFGKLYRFVRWRTTPVSDDEAAALAERYDPEGVGLEISYPLIVARPLVTRMNFLLPIPPQAVADPANQQPILLLSESSTVGLISADDVQRAMWVPSVLRHLAVANTACAMRDTLFAGTPLETIPLNLLVTALTAPSSQDQVNYQRLETLGDTVLKYIVSITLLSEFPLWHEGYLARRKDHAVSNAQLAKAAVKQKVYKWIVRDRFSPRKWKPLYVTAVEEMRKADDVEEVEAVIDEEEDQKAKKRREREKQKRQLSTKVLADVVESLIGASYVHGGFALSVECAKVFDLGLPWRPIPERIDAMRERIFKLQRLPSQLSVVEDIIGYTFTNKVLLVEALTHASYQTDLGTISYERMEFLGDSVLDMIVTDFLYHASGKQYSPGQMHLRKTAVVNAHFLAFVCLRASTARIDAMPVWRDRRGVELQETTKRVFLWQCLLHSSARLLDDQTTVFARWGKHGDTIQKELDESTAFPWSPLTSLQAPKFLSDMVESILGAIFLDTAGNLDVVRNVLRTLGIMQVLERIVAAGVDVQHPVSRLMMWKAKRDIDLEFKIEKGGGLVRCTIYQDEVEVVTVEDQWRGRISQEDVRFAAAERAYHILVAQEAEMNQPGFFNTQGEDVEEDEDEDEREDAFADSQ
ncbi:ribonuclease III [Heterobasidion irregulare TC 32-1]|uniref:Ribonuclease III n=1 Tax=Heterobasidion irregulare (strain TC 32-1) TaxID=747525 RepID=W4K6P7_HETIT|nr:ribonuclease III [Heterobasidion irregulare TC 32-1]ETW81507.1 ribonuclease III [Heterobasidion irregulare TC 32-1]